jgi:hypothetical protein
MQQRRQSNPYFKHLFSEAASFVFSLIYLKLIIIHDDVFDGEYDGQDKRSEGQRPQIISESSISRHGNWERGRFLFEIPNASSRANHKQLDCI